MIDLAETARLDTGVLANLTRTRAARRRLMGIYHPYQSFTMIAPETYLNNLQLIEAQAPATGCIVECGVWRGGMSAGMADRLGGTRFHDLMDSYEGLPPVQQIDGPAAVAYQADETSPG
jgi:O-methyltransferase